VLGGTTLDTFTPTENATFRRKMTPLIFPIFIAISAEEYRWTWASGMHAKQYSAIPPYLVVGGRWYTSIEYSGGSMGGSGIPTVLSIVVAKQSIQAFREGRSWRSPRTVSGL
jgi:hypothetical protein